PNLGRRLRPGMYAYGTISADSPEVLTIPASAVVTEGDVNVGYKSFCYVIDSGRVKRTQIAIGAKNDQLVEVTKKQVPSDSSAEQLRWENFVGTEEIVQSGLSGLKDGQTVEVSQPTK